MCLWSTLVRKRSSGNFRKLVGRWLGRNTWGQLRSIQSVSGGFILSKLTCGADLVTCHHQFNLDFVQIIAMAQTNLKELNISSRPAV